MKPSILCTQIGIQFTSLGLLTFAGKAPAPDLVSMGLRNYFRGHMMDEAAAFKPAGVIHPVQARCRRATVGQRL